MNRQVRDAAFQPRVAQASLPFSSSSGAVRRFILLLAFALSCLVLCEPARAVEAVRVSLDSTAIDLTPVVERFTGQGDRIQISTAPGADGIVRRIEVGAKQSGTKPNWIVFALTNDTDEQIERLLVAPHFRLVGSGLIWPYDCRPSRRARAFRPNSRTTRPPTSSG